MYDSGEKIVATDIKALKARVKAEMTRRNKTGSLATYGSSSYDYSAIPARNSVIKSEHYTKLREPISKINTTNLPPENAEDMPSLTSMEGQLTTYESYTGKSSGTHGCAGSCSGLCYNSCTSCSGCSGCSGCGGTCSYCTGCTGSCRGCGSGCASSCSGCSGSCKNGCTGTCTGCTGCSGNCAGKGYGGPQIN